MMSSVIYEWKRKIESTIESPRYVGAEINGDIQIAIGYAKFYNKGVYLYGNLKNMDCFLKFFRYNNLNVIGIIDVNYNISTENNKSFYEYFRTPILSEDDFHGGGVVYVFQCEELSDKREFIQRISSEADRVFVFSKYLQMIITTNSVEACDADRILYYLDKKEDLLSLIPFYLDEESLRVMNEYLRTYSERDVYRLPEIPADYKYFFGEEGEQLYTHKENEVWLNFGASTGDTIYSFFLNNLVAKKIIAIEAEKERYDKLIGNLSLLPPEMRNQIIAGNIYVQEDTDLNQIVGEEKITFINADIEGAELVMLQHLSRSIVQEHPVLALCVYHKKEDLVEIPQYILNLYDGYRFALRKYAFCFGNHLRNEELVLYAIPENRRVYI